MGKYSELLKDPRWQKKRLEILERDNWKCQMCGDEKSILHVHHKWYVSGRKPWEYSGKAYVTLCGVCHSSEHEIESTARELIAAVFLHRGLLFDDFIDITTTINDMDDKIFRNTFGCIDRKLSREADTK